MLVVDDDERLCINAVHALNSIGIRSADRNRSAHSVYNILGNGHAQAGSLGFLNTGIVLADKGVTDYRLQPASSGTDQ